MAIIRKTLGEAKTSPFKFSAAQKARIAAMDDTEIERIAEQDADNPPASAADLKRGRTARALREVRKRLAMTQEEFAQAYEIPTATVRDWEQGRREPDAPARAYLKAIASDPEAVRRALERAA